MTISCSGFFIFLYALVHWKHVHVDGSLMKTNALCHINCFIFLSVEKFPTQFVCVCVWERCFLYFLQSSKRYSSRSQHTMKWNQVTRSFVFEMKFFVVLTAKVNEFLTKNVNFFLTFFRFFSFFSRNLFVHL